MRLKSEIWVKSYLRRCQFNEAPAFVTRRGQSEGGAIFIVVNKLNGEADLYVPAPAGIEGVHDRYWSPHSANGGASVSDIEAYIERQLDFDPDIWVVEIEDRDGRHYLADELLPE